MKYKSILFSPGYFNAKLITRIGFGPHYTIIIIRSPHNTIGSH